MDAVNRSVKWAQLYRCFVFLSGLFVAIYMAFKTDKDSPYKFYFLVPLIYSIIILIFNRISKNILYIGMMTLLAIMYCKYIITPFINCLSGYRLWRGVLPKETYLEYGVWLTIFEMIAVLFTINIFEKFFYRDRVKVQITAPKRNGIYLCVVFLSIILLVLFPSLLNRLHFVFSSSSYDISTIQANGFVTTIFDFGKLILLLLVISYCKIKFDQRSSFFYVFISGLSVIAFLLFSYGTSRWSIAIPGIILIYMLTQLFAKYKRTIIITVGFVLAFGIIILSSVKMNYDDKIIGSNLTLWADVLQMYFSGPKNIAYAIEAKKYINVYYGYFPINIMFNDLFGSVAVISGLTNSAESSVSIFNTFVYGSSVVQDQIIPLMGQSFIYFGYMFAPLLTIFATLVMMSLDKKANITPDIMKYYIYSYTAVWFARAMMLNATIIFSHFTNTFCLFLIIKWINDKIIILKSNKVQIDHNIK